MKQFFFQKLKKLDFSQSTKFLLAVSGGVDSMVLLDLFSQTDFEYAIAHCNFSLRDHESDMDADFLFSVAKEKKCKIFTKKFNTVQYAKEHKISLQMAARELRYKWFKKIKKEHDFQFISTAHHMDDSVETLLINLIRGTGISGLHGIQEFSSDVIRPLLSFCKKDIYLYAKQNNIKYREDISNSDDKYVRNKIRNKIIPIMQEINPNVITSISKAIERVQGVEEIYNELMSKKKHNLLKKENDICRINVSDLLNETSPKTVLHEILSDFGFNDIDAVFKSLSSSSGKEFFNDNYYLIKDRNTLIISKHITNNSVLIYKKTKKISKPFSINFKTVIGDTVSFRSKIKTDLYIDYSKLKFPLLIRSWKKGDRFKPLGMQGFKKVSDYFIDEKFSLIEKKKARLLISDNKVVCIIGVRLDERFKLVENSKKVYIVQL